MCKQLLSLTRALDIKIKPNRGHLLRGVVREEISEENVWKYFDPFSPIYCG